MKRVLGWLVIIVAVPWWAMPAACGVRLLLLVLVSAIAVGIDADKEVI
jgi:hypothetical protein